MPTCNSLCPWLHWYDEHKLKQQQQEGHQSWLLFRPRCSSLIQAPVWSEAADAQTETSGVALQGKAAIPNADVAGLVADPVAMLQVAAPVRLEIFPTGECLTGW